MMDLTKLSAAKLWLISTPPTPRPTTDVEAPRDLPYLSTALYALVPVASTQVPTMTVDTHWRIYVNPVWLGLVSVREVGQELTHLLWHLLADHGDRATVLNVDATTAHHWKTATDATIASTLHRDNLVPHGMRSAAQLRLPAGKSAEEFYAQLSRLPPSDGGVGHLGPDDGCGSGCDGVPRTNELPPAAEGRLDSPDAKEIRRRVAIDYIAWSTARGDRPGEAWRSADKILDPTIAWEPLLGQAVRRAIGWAAGRGEYTYSRPSRRASSAPNVVLPGIRRPVPRLAMVIDTSASVDDGLLGRALGEVDGAIGALGITDTNVTVYSCDATIHTIEKVRRVCDTHLGGGGGTDLRTGLAAAEAERPRPDVIIVFTDGDTPWPPNPPAGCSVLVALLGRRREDLPPTPSWAVRVECLLE